ncbi:MAG: ABC transporter substrate-binding protein [Rubrivivax sp.]|nr:ABC transporter substrate-binding protein [Rubrivivax sp.]
MAETARPRSSLALRRLALRSVGAGLAALLAPPALRAQAEGRGRIVLGQSAALSGAAAQLGLQFQAGARLYFARLNARGGVLGRAIELKSLDDGYEPERCAANTRRLIDEGGIAALFGYIGTPTSLAALPLATAARLPFIAPFSGAPALREPFNRYAFHVRASYFDETARIVEQLVSVGMRNIAVFHQNDSYGQAGLAGVVRALAARQGQPVATATVERNSVDVAAAVKTIVAARPEAVVQVSAYKSCAAFVREARRAGFAGQFCNVSFVGTAALAAELGAEARGVVVSQVMPYPFAATTPIAGEFLAAAAGSNVEVNYSSIEGFVAAKTLVEGLRRSGGAGGETLVAALEGLRDFNLGGFFVDFNPTKHSGSNFVELTILGADGKVRR